MEIKDAIHLLEGANIQPASPQQWTDLGCGDGIFTRALAHLLPAGSFVYGVDKKKQLLPAKINDVNIAFLQHDFENDPLPLRQLDGMLLANSLHYCRNTKMVLQQLLSFQKAGQERFLIVEYDSTAANRWVPYPLSFDKMKNILIALGFKRVDKFGERPSVFRREKMYACQAELF
ncbi:MAG: class I SAM-dependent methyltransferase [Chitinophagaceae bacterium]|nr:class I SAM-dependent methyltransferase [Chitinophagaceae bacterium]